MLTPERWAFLLAAALGLAALPPLVGRLLARLGLIRPNFRAERIPVGYGLVIVLWSAPVLLWLLARAASGRRELTAYLLIVTGMGALGFADDLFGDRSATGLRGHFRAFLRGRVTTGFLKAVGGAALALGVARFILGLPWPDAFLDGALIALGANALNLLDLRPGRACAVFLVGALALILFEALRTIPLATPPLTFVLIPALLVYERDARARAMLGDTGSNPLGGALGLAFALAFPAPGPRLAALATLVALHLVAERWSLSALIERHPLLRRLDALSGKR